jgi:hypothetical protein
LPFTRNTAPDGEPYTCAIVMLTNGQSIAMEIDPDEAAEIVEELRTATIEKRPSHVVIHPLDEAAFGSEYHYPGIVCGFQRITASHKAKLDETMAANEAAAQLQKEQQMRAQMVLGRR